MIFINCLRQYNEIHVITKPSSSTCQVCVSAVRGGVVGGTLRYQESITVGVYSRETSNDICVWAACTVLLIAVLLLRRVTYKMAACAKRR